MGDEKPQPPPVFVVKAKKKPTLEIRATSLDVGTRYSCAVTLEDPVAAEMHCMIRLVGDEFMLEDLGSATGTFVGGALVQGPTALQDGDVIVTGVSQLVVGIESADGHATLNLEVKEKAFFFQGFDKKNPGLVGDRDEWKQSEVEFGRWPALRFSNLVAAFGGALLLAAILFGATREPLVDPGPLHATHAALFSMGDDVPDRLKAAVAIADQQGCAACHDSFSGTTLAKCAQCHEQMMQAQHPFNIEPSDRSDLPHAGWTDEACATCHVDHERGDLTSWTFRPPPEITKTTCQECHGEDVPTKSTRPMAPIEWIEEPLAYDAFPHDAHLAEGIAIECTACHELPEGEWDPSAPRDRFVGDFALVSFDTCMTCHTADEAQRAAAGENSARLGAREELLFALDWHGTDEGGEHCLGCHDSLHAKDLGTSPSRRVVEPFFEYRRRTHADEFEKHANGQACTDCHVGGLPSVEGDARSGRFWHGLHLASSDLSADMPGDGCLPCHDDMRTAEGLATDSYRGPSAQACKECHDSGELAPDDSSFAKFSEGSRVEFPHDVHVEVEACGACHRFAPPGSPDSPPWHALPMTTEGAKNCMDCHAGHASIAGDGCVQCHPKDDLAVWYGPQSVPAGTRTPMQSWPTTSTFAHLSPGHRASTEQKECGACHDEAGTRAAGTVHEVPIPSEADDLCRKCHVEERQRFHWR